MFNFVRDVTLVSLIVAVVGVVSESHTITFTNKCGRGTPMLIQGPNVISTGQSVTINGAFDAAIAYLQTGNCGFNGENCIIVETSLTNGFSSTDLSLIPPHAFSVTTGFGYFNGCDGAGADCTGPDCGTAFINPGDTDKQVGCPAANVDLAITFCD